MVVRHGDLDVGKRDFPPSRLQPYRHRRARGERCAQQLVGVRPRRRAAPAVGATDREHRCAGTAVERASAVKVAGHHRLWLGSAIDRIRHRAFLSSDELTLAPSTARAWTNAGSNSQGPTLPDGAVSGVEGLAALGVCIVLRRLATVVFSVVAY